MWDVSIRQHVAYLLTHYSTVMGWRLLDPCVVLCTSHVLGPVQKRVSGSEFLAALQSFTKVVNYQHIMPTRYTLDVDLKSLVTADVVDNSTKRKEVRTVRPCCPLALTSYVLELLLPGHTWEHV